MCIRSLFGSQEFKGCSSGVSLDVHAAQLDFFSFPLDRFGIPYKGPIPIGGWGGGGTGNAGR